MKILMILNLKLHLLINDFKFKITFIYKLF